MARQSGCTFVTIMDVDAGRVEYAISKGFATHGYVVPKPLHSCASSSSIFLSGTSTPASSDGAMTPLSSYSSISDRLTAPRLLLRNVLAVARPDMLALDEDEDGGVDVTFECTGKEACMQTSLYATKPGGKVIQVGMGTQSRRSFSACALREVDILGIFSWFCGVEGSLHAGLFPSAFEGDIHSTVFVLIQGKHVRSSDRKDIRSNSLGAVKAVADAAVTTQRCHCTI